MSAKTTFKPVTAFEGDSGPLKVVRGGRLLMFDNGSSTEAELQPGLVVEGIYEGSIQNKFNETKLDYKVRGGDDILVILNSTASLARQLAEVKVGELIQIKYNGRKQIKRKTGGMADMHDYQVNRAVSEA